MIQGASHWAQKLGSATVSLPTSTDITVPIPIPCALSKIYILDLPPSTRPCSDKNNMASKLSVVANLPKNLSRQSLQVARRASLLPQRCRQTNSTSRRPRLARISLQQRVFSSSTHRRLADAIEGFDPNSIDRESDQVDVCIVGGGKKLCHPHATTTDIFRTCWLECCDSIKAIGK